MQKKVTMLLMVLLIAAAFIISGCGGKCKKLCKKRCTGKMAGLAKLIGKKMNPKLCMSKCLKKQKKRGWSSKQCGQALKGMALFGKLGSLKGLGKAFNKLGKAFGGKINKGWKHAKHNLKAIGKGLKKGFNNSMAGLKKMFGALGKKMNKGLKKAAHALKNIHIKKNHPVKPVK